MSSNEILYRERLTPRAYAYVVVLALIAMVAIAYGAPFGARVGWIVFVGSGALAIWAMIATSPVIEITGSQVRVGRAAIDRSLIAQAVAMDPEAFRLARGRDADPRRYTILRAWHSGSGILLTLADPDDPHPSWLITTARPVDLAAALA